jgi:glutamate---cysteine ligase / carboxylate-amine ligase
VSGVPTIGVEEGFLLVDPRTGEPAPRNTEVAAEAENRSATLQLELSNTGFDRRPRGGAGA